jgi:PKD domain-containing protein/List-Bact-rpt repeat protein
MRLRFLVGLPCVVIVTLALALSAAPAGAVVVNAGGGRVSYLPLNGTTLPGGNPIQTSVPTGEPPLEYHGGPVMHSHRAYAILWAPSGYSFPAGYTAAIEEFLENVGADSGQASNVYSVSAQYTDGTGHASYSDSYGGSVVDTDAYPTAGTCPTYSGFGESFTACISDEKLEEEVDAVADAQGWPSGSGAEYYVVLPPHAGSCFDTAGNQCFDVEYCAYHSYSASTGRIYANISYSPGDVSGCGVGEYPNGHANGNADDTFSSLSHEANESITDPYLNAWFDEEGFENGDECRNTPFSEDFGPPLGGGSGSLFNQSIGGDHYYLQQEWSNDVEDCAQRVDPATPAIADPGQATPGQSVGFDGSDSVPGSGGILAYEWDFGDGHTATGPTPFHTFAGEGTFAVRLSVEDDGGFRFSTTRQVAVAVPRHELTIGFAGGGTGTVTGAGISCPGSCAHRYLVGEVVTLAASAAPESTFVGWSGACSGAGTCVVTMSSDHSVTATFTGSQASPGGGGEPAPPQGQSPAPIQTSTPTSTSIPTPAPTSTTVKCRAGSKRVKRHGKSVCVKARKHHHRR